MRSRGPERLVVVGRGANELPGGFRMKVADAEYFRGLLERFPRVELWTRVLRPGDPGFVEHPARPPEGLRIRPLESMPERGGLPSRVRALLAEQAELGRELGDGATMALTFIPNAYVPLVYLRHPDMPAVAYLGSDWRNKTGFARGGPLSRRLRAAYYRWGQALVLRRARGLIAAGEELAARLRERTGTPVIRTRSIMLLSRRHLDEGRDYEPDRPLRILFVGTFLPVKALPLLVRAWRRLRAAGSDVELWLVGTGEEEARLREMTSGEPGARLFEYVTDFDRLREIYRDADVFALPSLDEGFPRVLWEAMAHGLPVVSTAVGAVPRSLRDGEQALLVPAGDEDALAGALERLVSDPGLRRRLGRAGLERVRDELGTSAAEQHAAFLRDVWEGDATPGGGA